MGRPKDLDAKPCFANLAVGGTQALVGPSPQPVSPQTGVFLLQLQPGEHPQEVQAQGKAGRADGRPHCHLEMMWGLGLYYVGDLGPTIPLISWVCAMGPEGRGRYLASKRRRRKRLAGWRLGRPSELHGARGLFKMRLRIMLGGKGLGRGLGQQIRLLRVEGPCGRLPPKGNKKRVESLGRRKILCLPHPAHHQAFHPRDGASGPSQCKPPRGGVHPSSRGGLRHPFPVGPTGRAQAPLGVGHTTTTQRQPCDEPIRIVRDR